MKFILLLVFFIPRFIWAAGAITCMGYNTPLPGYYYATCKNWWDMNNNSIPSNIVAQIGTNLTLCANMITNTLNNMNVIHFNGTTAYAQQAITNVTVNQPFELDASLKCADSGTTTSFPLGPANITGSLDIRLTHGGLTNWSAHAGNDVTIANEDTNIWHSYFLLFNGASSEWAIDGTNVTVMTSTPGAVNINSICLGAYKQSTSPSQVDFRDVLIFSGTNDGSQKFTLWAKFLQPRLQ